MTETEELRAALSAGVRRPRLPMFVMGALSLGFVVTSLVFPTDLSGRIIGFVLAALFAAMAAGFYRQAASHVRLTEAFLANPQLLVWLTHSPADHSPGADGLVLGALDLYFDTGEQVRLMLPEPQDEEVYRHLRSMRPEVITETGPSLFALWKADPKSFAARAKELPRS